MTIAEMYLAENAYYRQNNTRANRYVMLPMMPEPQSLTVQRKVSKQTQSIMGKVKDISDEIIRKRDERQAKIDRRTERLREHVRFAIKEKVKRHYVYRWLTTPWMSQETRQKLNAQRAVLP